MADSPTKYVPDGCATELPQQKHGKSDYCSHAADAHNPLVGGCLVGICPCAKYTPPPKT